MASNFCCKWLSKEWVDSGLVIEFKSVWVLWWELDNSSETFDSCVSSNGKSVCRHWVIEFSSVWVSHEDIATTASTPLSVELNWSCVDDFSVLVSVVDEPLVSVVIIGSLWAVARKRERERER